MDPSPWQVWLALAILLFVAEALTQGFFVACFGAGAGLAALAALVSDTLVVQVGGFCVGTLAALVWIRPLFDRPGGPVLKTNADAYAGRAGRVVEAVEPAAGRGKVAVGGEVWKAASRDGTRLVEGETVVVERLEGLTRVVAPSGRAPKEGEGR